MKKHVMLILSAILSLSLFAENKVQALTTVSDCQGYSSEWYLEYDLDGNFLDNLTITSEVYKLFKNETCYGRGAKWMTGKEAIEYIGKEQVKLAKQYGYCKAWQIYKVEHATTEIYCYYCTNNKQYVVCIITKPL